MQKLIMRALTFGCDPEFFFSKDGRVLGAEKVLPEEGLIYSAEDMLGDDGGASAIGSTSKIIIDGVQAELNPRPNTCRANLGNEIACCFRKLEQSIKKMRGVGIDFRQTIKLEADDMEKLSDKSKKFGCSPSRNSHDGGRMGSISVDPSVYQYRSAGGHIHLGDNGDKLLKEVMLQPERLVNMLDLIVGNTCVLIDRDPGNRERRKVYGRAGEFRTPPHGVEYRTPSNFWLRSYQLMSLVMYLSRLAVLIVADNRDEELLKDVDMREVAEAINNNDFKKALAIFKTIEPKLMAMIPTDDDEHFDINEKNIHLFRHFVKKGLDHWFVQPPLEHWVNLREGHRVGFGTFLMTEVADDYDKTHG